jgi:hypothetical protein
MPSKKLTTVAAEPTSEDGAIQVEVTLSVRPRRQESCTGGERGSVTDAGSRPRIPRITRLMALAIKFQDMVDRAEVRNYADLARLGYVSRARLTQLMNLLLLAPKIQENLLNPTASCEIRESHLRQVVKHALWQDQLEFLDRRIK